MYKYYLVKGKLSAKGNQCLTTKQSFISLLKSNDIDVKDPYNLIIPEFLN